MIIRFNDATLFLDTIIYWVRARKVIYDNAIGWKNLLRSFTFSSLFTRNVKTAFSSTISDQARKYYKRACSGGSLSARVIQL